MKKFAENLAKRIGKQLLKLNWFNRRVKAYRLERENQKITNELELQHHRWSLIMHGMAVRDYGTQKDKEFDRFDCVNWSVSK